MIGRSFFGDNERLGYASIRKSLRCQLSDFPLAPCEPCPVFAYARRPVDSRITGTGGFECTLRSK